MGFNDNTDLIPLGCQYLDNEGRLIHVNQAWLDIFGYNKEDVIGRYFGEFLAPGELKNFLKNFMLLKSNGNIRDAELAMMPKDGSPLVVSIDGKVSYDSDGKFIRTFCLISDITEKKNTENILKESREKYRKLIYNINDIVWQTNSDSEFVYLSPQVEKVLGYKPDEMTGRSVFDFISEDDIENNRSVFHEAVLKRKKRIFNDTKLVHRDGHVVLVESSGSPLYDEENNYCGFIGVDRDVTERRKAEKALKEANKKLNLLSQITRHDIRNQILALNGYMAIISSEVHGEESKKHIKSCIKILDEIKRQILFTGEYNDIGTIEPMWQDPAELVEGLKKNFPVDIAFTSSGSAEIYADRMLEKVFFNLFNNSMIHGEDVSWISVFFSEADGYGKITVEDDGIGVLPEMKERIFERGFGKNSGYGLFLSREILDLTDIFISETGIPGEGARFEILIPEGGWRLRQA